MGRKAGAGFLWGSWPRLAPSSHSHPGFVCQAQAAPGLSRRPRPQLASVCPRPALRGEELGGGPTDSPPEGTGGLTICWAHLEGGVEASSVAGATQPEDPPLASLSFITWSQEKLRTKNLPRPQAGEA